MEIRKILLADDEAHIRCLLAFLFENAGYEVVVACDGEEALELACREGPDLLITDQEMPFLSGLNLCKRLREAPCTRHIEALMITDRGFKISPAELAQTQIRQLIEKPFSPRELLALIEQWNHPRSEQAA